MAETCTGVMNRCDHTPPIQFPVKWEPIDLAEKQFFCDHDWTGATVFQTASGKVIHWHTFRRWASFTSMARDPLIMEYQQEQGDPVVSAAVTCSKCGKPFNPPIFAI